MLMEMVTGRTADRGRDARQGRAARRDRRPALAGPPQVRAARAHDAEGRAAQGEGNAASRRARRLRRARAHARPRCPRSRSLPADEFPPGSIEARPPGPSALRRRLQLRRRAVRDRGSLLARRRPTLRGRLGRGDLPRRLPAPRLRVRPRDRHAAQPAGVPSRSRPTPCGSSTARSSRRLTSSARQAEVRSTAYTTRASRQRPAHERMQWTTIAALVPLDRT